MKEHNERRAYNKRHRHATPPAPVCPPLCLTVFGHYSESISTLTKSKGQMELPRSCRKKRLRDATNSFRLYQCRPAKIRIVNRESRGPEIPVMSWRKTPATR